VVTLSDPDKKRALFIWIGPAEARAIYAELQGINHFRPLTHDLLASVINEFNGEVHRVVITHAKENVFYATIMIGKDGSLIEIDARPSDSLVMALKFEAPVFVTKTLFERMSLPLEEKAEIEYEYGIALQELTPELSEYLSFPPKRGVMISGIRKGSQAEKDGLETGDIIVDIGGQLIENVLSMKKVFAETKEPVKAGIFRNSRFMTFTLHLP
jgi:bifunctional DNase/RNase